MELTTPAFQKAYKQLNPQQKQAVDTIEGPVMVIAGPGTGKTQVLATRIANILLRTDVKPHNILALTFTESAAKNMRERVVSLIGKTGYYVQISTFHAFCSSVIQDNPEFFPIERGSEPLTDLERYDLFQSIIEEMRLEVLKPLNRNLMYINEIMKAISDLKREGVAPADFEAIIAADFREFINNKSELGKTATTKQEKVLEKQKELLRVYLEYEKRLREMLRYDFDDMIGLVVQAFSEHELLLREYQENIHYFLVDEYQDTNAAQNKVVDMLASYWGEQANIFVVGDPHQSIFRFQGASVENMLGFARRYSEANVIALQTGYRCTQYIYDAAHRSICNNELTSAEAINLPRHQAAMEVALQQRLTSHHGQGSKASLYVAPSAEMEVLYVAEKIRGLLETGVEPEEIAVIYRTNAEAGPIQSVLQKWEVPYKIDGGVNILNTESIRQLLNLFTLISEVRSGTEDENIFEVMSYSWTGLDPVMVMRAARAAGRAGLSIMALIQGGYKLFKEYEEANGVSDQEFATLELFIDNLRRWGADDARLVFPTWVEQVVNESGYLDWVLEHEQKVELLTNLNSLFREIKSLAVSNRGLKLDDFLEAIRVMVEHNISLEAEDLNITAGAVHLSTVHKAKGREWEHVFLINCVDGRWGNSRKRDLLPLPPGLIRNTDLSKKERNEDDRRLFYVALTRAKKQVYFSYPQSVIAGNRTKEMIASMFLQEIAPELQEVSETEMAAFNSKSQDLLTKMLRPADVNPASISEEEFFRQIVKNLRYSVTTINTYLRDPQEFITKILLRVPMAKAPQMAFGTAIHRSLEEYYRRRQNGYSVTAAELFSWFETALRKELLTADDLQRRLEHGKKILQHYHQEKAESSVETLFIEKRFGGGMNRTILETVPLSGRIDRIDWVDRDKKLVRVIDYKTGSPKTSGDIEGRTVKANLSPREQELPESIRGNYKRQLLFYKLLTELDRTFVPVVVEGVFDFVEPDKNSGKHIERRFELLDTEVDDLKQLILQVAEEVKQLKFLEDLREI